MKNISAFKGSPRWRGWYFWSILAIYFGSTFGTGYLSNRNIGDTLYGVVLMLPFYTWMLLPSRIWIGKDWLLVTGASKIKFVRFEQITSFSVWDFLTENVTLHLIQERGTRTLRVCAEISKGKELKRFQTEMVRRHIPDTLVRIKQELDSETFSPPYSGTEAERQALYDFIKRPKPKS